MFDFIKNNPHLLYNLIDSGANSSTPPNLNKGIDGKPSANRRHISNW